MKIAFAFSLIILMGEANNFVLENARPTQQRAHLGKLQNFDQVSKARIVPWNDILAEVLVNKINIFSSKHGEEQRLIVDVDSGNGDIWKKCLSEVLYLYKYYVYDTFICYKKRINDNRGLEDIPKPPDTTVDDVSTSENDMPVAPTLDILNNKRSTGPKSEVELIEPRYHGKVQEDINNVTPGMTNEEKSNNDDSNNENTSTTDSNEPPTAKSTNVVENVEALNNDEDCQNGQHKDPEGKCLDPKSKYILFVPSHCPIGYRRDKRGVCRPTF